jgi:hypothetical protein
MTPIAPSSASQRMRRSRERRRRGCSLVTLEVPNCAVTDSLVALGWLPSSECCDAAALGRALIALIARAIEIGVTPATGPESNVSIVCNLRPATIQVLIELGWLPADQQQDCAAIVSAFCRFAGRAVDVARNGSPERWYFP